MNYVSGVTMVIKLSQFVTSNGLRNYATGVIQAMIISYPPRRISKVSFRDSVIYASSNLVITI